MSGVCISPHTLPLSPPQLNGMEAAVVRVPRHQLDTLTQPEAWRLAQTAPHVARHTSGGVSTCELHVQTGLGAVLRVVTEQTQPPAEDDAERQEVLKKRAERKQAKKEKREKRRQKKAEREREEQ